MENLLCCCIFPGLTQARFAIIQTMKRRQSRDGRHDVKHPFRTKERRRSETRSSARRCHVDESWGTGYSRPARCTVENTRAVLTQQLQRSSPAKQKTIASHTIDLRHLFHSVSLLGPNRFAFRSATPASKSEFWISDSCELSKH
ncbi:hypothetical protein BJY00DRAFT_47664 [Aspergillus carlsbadensis]|nr:hypothetical protein BJY00DRAFT_47664 [Aspergillus carlsbadensis]